MQTFCIISVSECGRSWWGAAAGSVRGCGVSWKEKSCAEAMRRSRNSCKCSSWNWLQVLCFLHLYSHNRQIREMQTVVSGRGKCSAARRGIFNGVDEKKEEKKSFWSVSVEFIDGLLTAPVCWQRKRSLALLILFAKGAAC